VGPGVIEAFYYGLETIDIDAFAYLCKLDLDLDLPPKYFAILMDRLEANPRIGTCSGKAYFRNSAGEMVSEGISDEMSLGMTKFFSVACFQDVGGFVREVMWDGLTICARWGRARPRSIPAAAAMGLGNITWARIPPS